MPTGSVLLAGGAAGEGTGEYAIKNSAVFDPKTDSIVAAGSLGTARDGNELVYLADIDKFMTMGGDSSSELWQTLAKGAACTTNVECGTGYCVDGVCCESECTGACRSCATPSAKGTCAPLDAVKDPRGICGVGDCGTGKCIAGACDYSPPTTKCGIVPSKCTAPSTYNPGSHCPGDGKDCVGGTDGPCPGELACASATACLTKCSSNADCVGTTCNIATGTCGSGVDAGAETGVDASSTETGESDTGAADTATSSDVGTPDRTTKPTVSSEFQRCTFPSDCASGFCVDGVCCDSACTDKCHSCALPSSPGKCTEEPFGVDLRHECGAALSCVSTCSAGKCVTSNSITICAPNHCEGPSTAVGSAFCPAAGGTCPTADAVRFDCSPYACEPVLGACRSICSKSDDCAAGFVCDASSRTCVTASGGSGDGGGCAFGSAQSLFAPSVALLAALVALGRRRRANSDQ
jgi:hypothetical protein